MTIDELDRLEAALANGLSYFAAGLTHVSARSLLRDARIVELLGQAQRESVKRPPPKPDRPTTELTARQFNRLKEDGTLPPGRIRIVPDTGKELRPGPPLTILIDEATSNERNTDEPARFDFAADLPAGDQATAAPPDSSAPGL